MRAGYRGWSGGPCAGVRSLAMFEKALRLPAASIARTRNR
jgi:hypothetical protein